MRHFIMIVIPPRIESSFVRIHDELIQDKVFWKRRLEIFIIFKCLREIFNMVHQHICYYFTGKTIILCDVLILEINFTDLQVRGNVQEQVTYVNYVMSPSREQQLSPLE